jgi:hypothetical protein
MWPLGRCSCGAIAAFSALALRARGRRGGALTRPGWRGREGAARPGNANDARCGCLRLADATAAAGLGLLWQPGEKSRLAVRGLLLVEGTAILVQLSVRSTMTGFLLAALLDHVRVCEAADSLIDRSKHPELVALHELALPLCAGTEQAAGKGETTAQITPLISGHPADLDRAYVSSCWRSKAVHEASLAAWDGIMVWAAGYRSGETNGDSHLDEAPPERPSLAPGVQPRARVAKIEEADLPL